MSIDTTTEYEYTDAGQLKTRDSTAIWTILISGTTRTVETFTYATDTGLLKEISSQTGNENPVLFAFTFDTSSRLSKIVGGGSTYTVEYGTDGNVDRTTEEHNGTITYREYTYNGGSVAGILANPMVQYGELFDMAGRPLPTDQVYLTSGLMGLD
ncbi:MAG: hypothetical protein QM765_32000 [Myxococcales bacterium]